MPRIYADNAATTKISQTAMKAMISAMENSYGNPSSIHQIGMSANDALQPERADRTLPWLYAERDFFYIRWDRIR